MRTAAPLLVLAEDRRFGGGGGGGALREGGSPGVGVGAGEDAAGPDEAAAGGASLFGGGGGPRFRTLEGRAGDVLSLTTGNGPTPSPGSCDPPNRAAGSQPEVGVGAGIALALTTRSTRSAGASVSRVVRLRAVLVGVMLCVQQKGEKVVRTVESPL